MRVHSRRGFAAAVAAACSALIVALSLSGCAGGSVESDGSGASRGWFAPAVRIPGGTPIDVRLTSTISSETATRGTGWTGVTTSPVVAGDRVVIPAGSPVYGVVSGVRPAKRGTRAMLDLTVQRVEVDGKSHKVPAGAEPVVAGSTRARNLGAIATGAAAGALIGKAVGGDGKDAVVGGILGGAAAGGAVAASKGYQVVLKSGTVMKFTVDEPVAMR